MFISLFYGKTVCGKQKHKLSLCPSPVVPYHVRAALVADMRQELTAKPFLPAGRYVRIQRAEDGTDAV